MNPRELADQARDNVANRYREYANRCLQYGISIHPIDTAGARALWLDGMKALDAAEETERGKA